MSSDTKILKWRDIWNVVRDPTSEARTRALRETTIVVAGSLLPLMLGALLAYVADRASPDKYNSFWFYLYASTLGGQLFLLFLSLAATNFSRLWDPQAPKVEYAGLANGWNALGALLTSGLIAIDQSMSKLSFFPVNLLSALFFTVSIAYYFWICVPSYMDDINIVDNTRTRGEDLADRLDREG